MFKSTNSSIYHEAPRTQFPSHGSPRVDRASPAMWEPSSGDLVHPSTQTRRRRDSNYGATVTLAIWLAFRSTADKNLTPPGSHKFNPYKEEHICQHESGWRGSPLVSPYQLHIADRIMHIVYKFWTLHCTLKKNIEELKNRFNAQ
jgi:hypothetical protein